MSGSRTNRKQKPADTGPSHRSKKTVMTIGWVKKAGGMQAPLNPSMPGKAFTVLNHHAPSSQEAPSILLGPEQGGRAGDKALVLDTPEL